MMRRGGIVTVSCGDFRCRLEGFEEPLAALAAVSGWLATASWGEHGLDDPPPRGAPSGIRREIRNGALVLTPVERGADASDPILRGAEGWSAALSPEPGPGTGPEDGRQLDSAGSGAAEPVSPGADEPTESHCAPSLRDEETEEALDLRLLARVAQAAASGERLRSPQLQPSASGQADAASVAMSRHEGVAGVSMSEGKAGGSDAACPGAASRQELEEAGALEPLQRGTIRQGDWAEAAEPLDAPRARTPSPDALAATDTPAAMAETMAMLDAPEEPAAGKGTAAPPVVPSRPRRPAPPIGVGGETPGTGRPGIRGMLAPLRLLPTQRIEPPHDASAAPPAPAAIRPRRPVHRRSTSAPPP